MKLNRNNYEEYFILYLDNELDSDDRREVEAFAKQNPDLATELEMLMQSKLTPDADILYADKGSLMRFDSASISLSNYEEWLTAYIDNELTDGERKDVEVFVAGNPSIQRQLNLLLQTKLQPEAIVFPYKESLYRKEENTRVISMRWWRVAAAAVLLIGVSTTAFFLVKNNATNEALESAVSFAPEFRPPVNNNSPVAILQPKEDKMVPETQSPVVTAEDKQAQKKNEQQRLVAKKVDIVQEVKKEQPGLQKDEKALLVAVERPKANDLTTPSPDNKNVFNEKTQEAVTASIVPVTPGSDNLTDKGSLIAASNVTTETPEPSYAVEKQSGNKGIRGLLRKVTRTFEKRTNIKATDEDDRLLIAGLTIKL
jgi:hypothetical protein